MDNEFWKKVFELIFSKIGIGAIFLFAVIIMWMQMQEMQQRSEGKWDESLKLSEHRFEKLMEEERKDRRDLMETTRACCKERNPAGRGTQ